MNSKSPFPSVVVVGRFETPAPTVFEFLVGRFPAVDGDIWRSRIESGDVFFQDGEKVALQSRCKPFTKIFYYRELPHEEPIPFNEEILYSDDRLLVVHKPHFLPVTPAGRYVNECLLYRLRRSTGIDDLTPLHRIDKESAGLVIFSIDKRFRGIYQSLFLRCEVDKEYEAVSAATRSPDRDAWLVENRLEQGVPWFRMQIATSGIPNATTRIELVRSELGRHLFRCRPRTGKKHQIRIHLASIGYSILNDLFYPDLLPGDALNFDCPLKLLAKRIGFRDPVSGRVLEFSTPRSLNF